MLNGFRGKRIQLIKTAMTKSGPVNSTSKCRALQPEYQARQRQSKSIWEYDSKFYCEIRILGDRKF